MAAPALLSLGSVNADFQMRIPAEIGDIETQLAYDFVRLSGGKATNRAFLGRRFGCPARLFGRVGDDELARQALGRLGEDGVDLEGVTTAPGTSTAVSIIVVPPSGKKRIFLASNANACWDAAAARVLEDAVRAAPEGSVLAIDYEVPPEIAEGARRAAAETGLRVVIDPSPGERVPADAIRGCAAIAPNVEEAARLTGIEVRDPAGAARAAKRLADAGAVLACVKLADGGAVAACGQDLTFIAAPEVEAVDTTGAGDAFTGALAIGLLQGRSALDSACLAVAAATMAVTRFGSQHENLAAGRIEPLAADVRRGARPV